MPFLGNTPAESYISFAKQDITGNGGTSYSLNHPVTNAADIELFVNNVQQEPTTAYTASGSTLTLSEAIASTDDCYCIFRGRALQTTTPPDGSVTSAKLDTNIAVSGDLTVDTNTLYVDSTNNRVGIGTTSPSGLAEFYKAGTSEVLIGSNNAGTAQLSFYEGTSSTKEGFLKYDGASNNVVLGTSGAANAVNVARDTGSVFVGGTGPIVYSKLLSQFNGSSNYGIVANDTSNSANTGFMAFAVNGNSTSGSIGTILRNGSSSAVLYNTTSDERLKENIADADDALSVVDAIQVRKYDWKDGGQHEDYGFIAQELAEVVNHVVSTGRTEEDMWGVDYGKLTPLLVKAIQEQQVAIEALTARVTSLEAS